MDKALKLPVLPGLAVGPTAGGLSMVPSLLKTFSGLFLMSVTDLGGKIIDVNDSFCAVSGFAREELMGANHRLLASGYHPPEFFRDMWRDIAAGRIWRGEICNRNKDGRIYWVDSVIAPEQDDEGRIIRYISLRTDITARKQAERMLQATRHFADGATLGWWEVEMDTGKVFWSDEVCRLHGKSPGYHPALHEAFDYVTAPYRHRVRAAFQRCADEGVGWDIEMEIAGEAIGGPMWLRSVGNAEWLDGSVVRVSGAVQDISARVAMERLNRRVTLAAESGQIGIWEYDIATGGLIWDKVMYRLYGLSEATQGLSYADWRKRLHPDDRQATLAAVAGSVGGGPGFNTEFRIIREDGETRHIRATAQIEFDNAGVPARMTGVQWDVTELRQVSAELAQQRELLQVTLESIGDAVITTDEVGAVSWMNPVAERLCGWGAADAKGHPLAEVLNLVHQETRQPAPCPALVSLALRETVGMPQQTVLLARGGAEYYVEDSASPMRNAKGEVLGVVVVFRDVTEQRRYANEMSYRATHDALTGLINRVEFDARLKRVLATAQNDGSVHSVMCIDLDQFKLVNDACGHSVGDALLQQVARLLERCVRARDTVARMGGDEFAILLERCPAEQGQRIAEKICAATEEFRFTHEGRRFHVGASIGLVAVDMSWRSTAGVLQAADTSSYMAKAGGGNRVHLWAESDAATASRHSETDWAARIEQALDEDRFTLFAQRIQGLDDAPVTLQAEVLLRMVAADGRLIEPRAFLPAAERFHLATRIDRWVIRNALKFLSACGETGNIAMLSVNLSGQSLGDRMFHRFMIDSITALSPDARSRLCLEITETAAITNMQEAGEFVDAMRKFGVRMALDDFGAGASSFGYLKKLAVDIIKIDGQFITGLIENPLDDAAVRCFADVAQVMGVKTVAEFVDREDVLTQLKRIGIDYGQGFMLHRPQPIEALLEVA